jgi:Protein of unknown function (DUF3631)
VLALRRNHAEPIIVLPWLTWAALLAKVWRSTSSPSVPLDLCALVDGSMSSESRTIPISKMAELLGGDVRGGEVLCPGPGHSTTDRSLSVKGDATRPDGFLVHSFSGDDPIECRDHVRNKLGLPNFEPKKISASCKKSRTGKAGSPIVATYIYRTTDGQPYLRIRKTAAKDFFQSHWKDSVWVDGKPAGAKLPYRLPQLIAASLTTPIYITEGEKDADNLGNLGFIATTNSEGADTGTGKKWTPELNAYFKNRHVVMLPDNDDSGRKHAEHVARNLYPVAASVRVIRLPGLPAKGDVSDWLVNDPSGARLVRECEVAPLWEPGVDSGKDGGTTDDDLILELAGLSKLAYARRRKEAAKQIGITVAELAEIVADMRGERKEPSSGLYKHWNVEPWDQPVDGGILLRALTECLRRYVFITRDQVIAVALWIIFTWLHDYEEIVTHSPILFVTSPEKDSGKTTLLKVASFLARRSVPSVSISGPALFRSIEKWAPCFVLDEADKAFIDNEDLRSVVNSGWTRGDSVIRCDPITREPRPYSTFAPKAIGMKGRGLPDTTQSRCVVITMKPKRDNDPDEQTEDFNHLDNETFARLRQQLLRWAMDNADVLARATPESPPGFHNRRRANWRTLLAIAEAVGGGWKLAAWKAAIAIEHAHDTFDPAIGVQLLADIRDIFARLGTTRMTSATLIAELIKDGEKPWATLTRGNPITENRLARMLKEFQVRPRTVRTSNERAKGYQLAWFEDAFGRYLSPVAAKGPFQSVTPGQVSDFNDLEQKQTVTSDLSVTVEIEPNSLKTHFCHDVTDGNSDVATARHDWARNDWAAGTPEDRTCAQCRGPVDGKERQVATGGKTVWLHPECERFHLEAEALPW